MCESVHRCFFFFFNDTATTEIYTLSLHDALPISRNFARPGQAGPRRERRRRRRCARAAAAAARRRPARSEEHTSELQSRQYLVCRLLLEKKKKQINQPTKVTVQHSPMFHYMSDHT